MAEFTDYRLYKGEVLVKFYPNSHAYYVNGQRKTGVTSYLGIIDKSRQLVIWATELYRDYLLDCLSLGITEDDIYEGSVLHEKHKKDAAVIGDEVHTWIEQYIKDEHPDMPERKEAQIGVTAFLDWVDRNHVQFLSSERVVYSRHHDYVGKMDIEALVNGELCLIDIKTSNGLYNTYGLQTAAYVKADEEESGRKYHGRWLIRLAKETEDEYYDRMDRKNRNRERKGYKTINIPPYQVFEAKFLDEDEKHLNRDFAAFLNAKALYEWNKETDTFGKKETV